MLIPGYCCLDLRTMGGILVLQFASIATEGRASSATSGRKDTSSAPRQYPVDPALQESLPRADVLLLFDDSGSDEPR